MADTLLDIVNEQDEVIGQALRSEIHGKGLLHREIHIWFITPDKKIIFQKRSMSKETNPGLLTVAVGGHVELGQEYIETALMETQEETGLSVLPSDLHYFGKYQTDTMHPETNIRNRSIRALFGMVYKGDIHDLAIEEGDATGFVAMPVADLISRTPELEATISPGHMEFEFDVIYPKLEALLV